MIESQSLTAKANIEQASLRGKTGLDSILRNLRGAEKIILFYLTYLTLEAMLFPLSLAERVTATILNVGTSAVLTLLARYRRNEFASTAVNMGRQDKSTQTWTSKARVHSRSLWHSLDPAPHSKLLATIRDWFPAVLILLVYRESGLFFVPDPTHHLDYLFVGWDRVLLNNAWLLGLLNFTAPWLQRYLEFCYMLCYPLVPLGLGALYVRARRPAFTPGRSFSLEPAIDQFWTAVLLALFTCYALFPFFPSTPPRIFFHDLPGPAARPLFRELNFWILAHYGIECSVFPSGHVAAVTAVSLSVRHYWPRAGILFLIIAVSVAVSTVIGRYHYAADALTGGLIGVLAFIVSKRIHKA